MKSGTEEYEWSDTGYSARVLVERKPQQPLGQLLSRSSQA